MNFTTQPTTIPILIVDDRPENLMSLESLLENQEYEIVRALSGNEALRLSLKQNFALVLLDVQMPLMDGFETAELMRTNPKTSLVPIIFITAGMKNLQFQFKGYDVGAVDYLTKPVEPAILLNKVRIFAELYRQRHQIELHKEHLEELVALRTAEVEQSAADLKISNEQLLLDAAERKRMEEQIRQTQKMDVIGQLAGGVAHDFNNMLTAIIGSSEMMERHIKDNPAAQKLLDSIQRAANRSADLTGQLLAFSRKEQKKNVRTNIDTIIEDVILLLERTISKNITLETRLIAKNSAVNGDPSLLQNALLNLGVNASDAMPEGGFITFTTANINLDSAYCQNSAFTISPGSYIEIAVSDTGSGMKEDIIHRIFEPFFTTKEVGKGTGLGLAGVYNAVTDHKGCISVYSKNGIGSVFKIYLPLAEEDIPRNAPVEELIYGSGGILLVDDEDIIREVGQALLEELGYQVYLAEDGLQAIEVYNRERDNISLIILDMLMPRMAGKEALAELKDHYPEVPVLVSSGFHHTGTVDDLKKMGAKGFLQKPYLRHDLSKAVADAMTR